MVKIRLARNGRKELPSYRIVVSDSRSPRDGKFIEEVADKVYELKDGRLRLLD